MSDILLLGTAPTSEEGKEYFLHCSDWWYDMLAVFDILLSDTYPLYEHFTRDLPLAPPTPTMNAAESQEFSGLVEKILQDGSARECLWKIYHTDQTQIEYFDGDEELINDNIDTRINQLMELASFLKHGGGCAAKWYTPD